MAHVLFLQNAFYEKLGVMQLSSVLKAAGHTSDLLIPEGDREELLASIRRRAPDIIAFSLLTTEQKWAREVAAALRPAGIEAFVIAGGPHPTFFPDFIHTEGIDAINVGEGEYALRDLAGAIDAGADPQVIAAIPNLVLKRGDVVVHNPVRPMVDLEQLPLPDRELYLQYDYFRTKDAHDFVVSMGCPYSCAYCFFHQWNELYRGTAGRRSYRLKSVERCMQEIEALAAQISIPLVSYVDSTFNLDKAWMLDFLRAYRERIDLPFTLNLRPNLVDEEIVSAIARTGRCRIIRMGVEVGDEDYRRRVLRKKITNAQILEAGRLLRKYDIPLMTYNMYCLPGETLEQALKTVEINQALKPAAISSMIFHPYPGLDITDYALEQGFLDARDISKLELRQYKWFRSVMSQPEVQEVQNLCLLSRVGIRHPIAVPLLRQFVRLPPNKLFDLVAFLGLVEMGMKYYDVGIWRLMKQHVIGDKSKMV